ncbi:MAG TPA: MarR family transcriptional regulator [Candidatus Dormibacteraeota bacterium]|nr:MarR family transcriptional regulator [Candidatus Dormibacteraeota bacterium]
MDDATEAWALLVRISDEQVRSRVVKVSHQHDLSGLQVELLRALALESPLPQREVARRLYCDPSNVTGLADQLEARGLVERRFDQPDRRLRPLALTDQGRALWEAFASRMFEPPDAITALPPADQRRLRDLLRRIVPDD